jgi:predicted transcriptional regulator of viral defense system
MKSREARRVLAEVTESQWGMVTSAQASARGVSHMNLTRLTESGDLIRLSHGVYRDAGAPGGQHEELRAAWLATDPAKLAYERLSEDPKSAVVSGESAARLHGIGDLRAMRSEFTTPARKQTQRADVRYRTRVLPEQDVTVREGLPTTTRERTIADLVEDRNDLSIVGNALRDAARQSQLDVDRLTELLSPLAERNGHRKGDGDALLEELLRVAGIDQHSIAKQIASIPSLGGLIAARYLEDLPKVDTTTGLAAQIASSGEASAHARLAEQLRTVDWASLALASQPTRKEG